MTTSTSNEQPSTSNIFSPAVRQMLAAVTFFATMSLCVKALPHIPAMEVVFFRCLISLVLSYFWLKKRGLSVWGKPENRFKLWGRGISGTIALFLFFLTMQHIPLATAVTIQYLSPIFTAILAMIFLNEKLRPVQWLFFAISFLGAVLLKGFDDRISWFYLGLGVLSAMLSGVAYNFVRSLSGREQALVVVIYFQVAGTLLGGAFTAFNFYLPAGRDWLLLLGVGLTAHIAQVLLTKALHGEKAAIITSLVYVGAVYASIFGWLIFGEHLTWGNVLAISLIIIGVLLNIWMNAGGKLKRRAAPEFPGR